MTIEEIMRRMELAHRQAAASVKVGSVVYFWNVYQKYLHRIYPRGLL